MARQIDQINDSPKQKYSVTIESGVIVDILLQFMPTQSCWLLDVTNNNGFVVKGIRLTVSPNVLNQFRNIINFGFAVTSRDGGDPQNLNDFSSNRIRIYSLSAEDVKKLTSFYFEAK